MVRERRNWTAEEDSLLRNAVELARSARNGDLQSLPWNAIALSVPDRTNKDCRKRFHYKVSSNVNRGAWTRSEDEKLRAAVQKHGSKWSRVAVDVGTRNGDQCSKRWKNTIDPRIDRSAWNSQDEQLLIQSVEKMGHNWKAIVNDHFPGRTALQARNQYNQFCRRTGSDTHPSIPGSMQSPPTSLARNRSHSSCSPARTKSRGQHSQRLRTETDSEDEESDDISSSADENDDDDYNLNWSQSGKCSQMDPDSEVSRMQRRQNSSHHCDIPQFGSNSLTSPLPSDGMSPFSSFDYPFPDHYGFAFGDNQALEQASNQSYLGDQVVGHSLSDGSPSHLDWIGYTNTLPAAINSSTNREIRKRVVIAATCSNTELANLMHTITEALASVSFSITSQKLLSATEGLQFLEGSRHIVITASCLSDELGKLMQMVTDSIGSVSFTISSGDI